MQITHIQSKIAPNDPREFSGSYRFLPSIVDQFFQTHSFELFKSDPFSSQKYYKFAEIVLLSSSCIGIIGSIGLLVIGMRSISLIMVCLSAASAIGSSLSREIATHKKLLEKTEENNRRFNEDQVGIFKGTIRRLENEVYVAKNLIEFKNDQLESKEKELQKERNENQLKKEQLDRANREIIALTQKNLDIFEIKKELFLVIDKLKGGSIEAIREVTSLLQRLLDLEEGIETIIKSYRMSI